jgi:hypothetical protein
MDFMICDMDGCEKFHRVDVRQGRGHHERFSRLRVLSEPNFARPIAVTNSGWSSADFNPLMQLVWPTVTGICKTGSASRAM